MTPKKRAIYLINLFACYTINTDNKGNYSLERAKKCALLCCDEIITSCDLLLFTPEIEYFEKVKEEIINYKYDATNKNK